jgi:hypothetical protein
VRITYVGIHSTSTQNNWSQPSNRCERPDITCNEASQNFKKKKKKKSITENKTRNAIKKCIYIKNNNNVV